MPFRVVQLLDSSKNAIVSGNNLIRPHSVTNQLTSMGLSGTQPTTVVNNNDGTYSLYLEFDTYDQANTFSAFVSNTIAWVKSVTIVQV